MHKKITFRSMAHSDAIVKYIHTKSEKIDKFFKREQEPISFEITLEPHREKHYYKVEFKIHTSHYHIVLHDQGMDMYMMIDEIIHKMAKEIARKKEKMLNEAHHKYSFGA